MSPSVSIGWLDSIVSGGRVPVTAKLSRKFYERLGDDVAAELVDWFNAVDATYKAELKETNELNWERFKATLHQEISSLRAELLGEISSVRSELRAEMKAMQADLMKWMFIYWSGTVAAIIGMSYFAPK
jgi:hypothetical protein